MYFVSLKIIRYNILEENKFLSDKNLRDIILNFVIAGRDTTAQALSWSIFRLCNLKHQEVQRKAREEIQSVLSADSESCDSN